MTTEIPFKTDTFDLKAADMSVLVGKRKDLIDSLALLKGWLEDIDEEIAKRIDIPSIFDRHDKSYGEITEEIGGRRFKVKITKNVKWNSDGLLSVAKTMPWEMASNLFDIDFSMGEKKYSSLRAHAAVNEEAASVLKEVDAARTVRFAEPKLVSVEDADA